jgi:hypothetical protein
MSKSKKTFRGLQTYGSLVPARSLASRSAQLMTCSRRITKGTSPRLGAKSRRMPRLPLILGILGMRAADLRAFFILIPFLGGWSEDMRAPGGVMISAGWSQLTQSADNQMY